MRIVVAVLVTGLSLLPVAAGARREDRAYVVDPGLVTTTISGPRTIVVTGNPFRYPWTLTVNGRIVSATGPAPFPAQFSPPLGPATDAPGNGDGATAEQCRDLTTLPRLTTCVAELEARVQELSGTPPLDVGGSAGGAYRTVRDAQREFVALQQRTDVVLAAQAENLGSEEGRPAAVRALRCLIGNDLEIAVDCGKADGSPNRVTVESVNAKIARVGAYPARDLAAAKSDLDQLKGAVRSKPVSKDGRAPLDRLTARLDAIDVKLQPYLAGGAIPKAYDDAVAQLHDLRATVLANVTPSQFFAVVSENCPGLLARARSTLVTITRAGIGANFITITCAPRALLMPRR